MSSVRLVMLVWIIRGSRECAALFFLDRKSDVYGKTHSHTHTHTRQDRTRARDGGVAARQQKARRQRAAPHASAAGWTRSAGGGVSAASATRGWATVHGASRGRL